MPNVLSIDPTPNENALKFTVDRRLTTPGSKTFANAEAAQANGIAAAVFQVAGVKSVFMVNDFITVTKQPDAYWEDITEALRAAIEGASD